MQKVALYILKWETSSVVCSSSLKIHEIFSSRGLSSCTESFLNFWSGTKNSFNKTTARFNWNLHFYHRDKLHNSFFSWKIQAFHHLKFCAWSCCRFFHCSDIRLLYLQKLFIVRFLIILESSADKTFSRGWKFFNFKAGGILENKFPIRICVHGYKRIR